jgi:lysophospholipase-3
MMREWRLLLAALLFPAQPTDGTSSPVVIIPGDGSNQLEARLDKPSVVSSWCSQKSDWFRLWLDTTNLLLGTTCWADNIKLVYDEKSGVISNNAGVETRVPDFGGTSAFEELDPGVPGHATAAFRKMVLALTNVGYERNVTLRGAPYDFRYAPSSPVGAHFIEDLRGLIEETVRTTGKRVVLVSHSMGCLQGLYLLNQQTQEWKDEFIEKWIPLAGPFGGSAKEMRLHASGDNQGLPVSSLKIREEQRSYETNFWLAPTKEFGPRVLISTLDRNYTILDVDAFFDDIGFPAGKSLYRRTENLTSAVQAPGVDVVCMYSLGVPTPTHFQYGAGGFDEAPAVTNGDGDGTVNDLSLRLCDRWAEASAQGRTARVQRFSGVTHSGMLTDDGVIKAILAELGLASPAGVAEGRLFV